MIPTDEKTADRPLRNHFTAITFGVLAFMAIVIILAALLFHFEHPRLGQHRSSPSTAPAMKTQPQ